MQRGIGPGRFGIGSFGLPKSPIYPGGIAHPESIGHQFHPGGLIHSHVPGRTDQLRIAVPHESHVIPADVISGLGQGNTMAGSRMMDQMLGRHRGYLHRGGKVSGVGHVPIVAAGGEYVVTPEEVAAIGRGDMKKGHDTLDDMIKRVRNYTVKRLKKLPPPKK